MRRTAAAIGVLAVTAWGALAAPAWSGEPGERLDLSKLGYSLSDPARDAIRFTPGAMLVPTPWGVFDVTFVSRPLDQMLRLPLSPAPAEPAPPAVLQPYVSAGSRKPEAGDDLAEFSRADVGDERQARPAITAGAGVLWRLDPNVELFGEYQFMRVRPEIDLRNYSFGGVGVRTEFDPGAFTWGISIKY